MESSTQRIDWIDRLRGIAFFFVVLGHVALPKETTNWIYSFHMPLFFMISGLTLQPEKMVRTRWQDFLRKKFRNMIIPYLWMSFLCYPLWFLAYHLLDHIKTSIGQVFQGIFLGNNLLVSSPSNALWFLLVLFLGDLLYFGLVKLAKGDQRLLLVCVVLSACIGFADRGVSQLWHFNVAFTAVPLMYLGNTFIRWYRNGGARRLKEASLGKMALILVVLALIGWASHTANGRISMTANKFGNSLLLFYVTATAFSLLITLVVMRLPNLKIINYIGQNTLFYMGVHVPMIRVFEKAFPEIFAQYRYSVLLAVVLYFAIALLCVLVRRWFPYVCGKGTTEPGPQLNLCKVLLTVWCAAIPIYGLFKAAGIWSHSWPILLLYGGTVLAFSILFVALTRRWWPVLWLEDETGKLPGARPEKASL